MEGTRREEAIERLSEALRILGVANRLDLLQKLLVPRTVAEIDLPPSREDADQSADRPLSRQAIEHHLERLQSVGLVTARAARREGRAVTEWQTSPGRLFLLSDDLRRLSASPPSTTATMPAAVSGSVAAEPAPLPPGPCLLAANGPWEGRAWPLEGKGPWTLGRERSNDIAITYDPFVSREHARIERRAGATELVVLGKNKQTHVNWRDVDATRPVPLRAGDTLGLGRSLLVLREG